MMMRNLTVVALWVVAFAGSVGAQAQSACTTERVRAGACVGEPDYPVKTYALHRLSPTEAMTLVAPYVAGANMGVFPGGVGRTITVRAPGATLTRVDSLLREYDRPATTLVLRF